MPTEIVFLILRCFEHSSFEGIYVFYSQILNLCLNQVYLMSSMEYENTSLDIHISHLKALLAQEMASYENEIG